MLEDDEVTADVHPFSARYLSHCTGPLRDDVDARTFRTRGERLYFQGTTDGQDAGLWVSDGTASGTRWLAPASAYTAGAATPFVGEILPATAGTYFVMERRCPAPAPWPPPLSPMPLWWTDERGMMQTLLREYELRAPTLVQERLYVTALGDDGRAALWTVASGPGEVDELGVFDGVTHVTPLANGVLFSVRQGSTWELWTSDGSRAGTRYVAPICAFGGPQIGVGALAYFTCGRQLWQTDGTPHGTLATPGAPDAPEGLYHALVALDRRLIFFYQPTWREPRVEVWVSDGTAVHALTTLATLPTAHTGSPGSLSLALGGALYFMVDDTLWRTDGTAPGTAAVAVLPPRAADPTSYARRGGAFMASVGGALLVVMNDAELWRVEAGIVTPVALDADVGFVVALVTTPTRAFYAARPAHAGPLALLSLHTLRFVPR